MVKSPRLAIFRTFKTQNERLTGEAIRQRSILAVLAGFPGPAERTRTAISQNIASKNDVSWKNIYSGIFRDVDEVFLPLGLVLEEGRLPLKRGPKALQEKGIPYYRLTPRGLLACLSIIEVKESGKIMAAFFSGLPPEERNMQGDLERLTGMAPRFTQSLFEGHVKAYCEGVIDDLLPLDAKKLGGSHVTMMREFLDGYSKLGGSQKSAVTAFLDEIV